jgi:hypothetical protein
VEQTKNANEVGKPGHSFIVARIFSPKVQDQSPTLSLPKFQTLSRLGVQQAGFSRGHRYGRLPAEISSQTQYLASEIVLLNQGHEN